MRSVHGRSTCPLLKQAPDQERTRSLVKYDNVAIDLIAEGRGPLIVLLPSRGRDSEDYDEVAAGRAESEKWLHAFYYGNGTAGLHELVSEENRIDLARSLTDVVHAADERLLPAASPIARAAVRGCRPQLLAVAARLFDVSKPVSARGVLQVERLLTDGSGPLYGRGDGDRLLVAATRILAVLDGGE